MPRDAILGSAVLTVVARTADAIEGVVVEVVPAQRYPSITGVTRTLDCIARYVVRVPKRGRRTHVIRSADQLIVVAQ